MLERKRGVAGYRETQDELEKVSSKKSELDEMKGRTLDDMSEMVRRLHAEIADRRNTLAPILREIRPLREKVQVCISLSSFVLEIKKYFEIQISS